MKLAHQRMAATLAVAAAISGGYVLHDHVGIGGAHAAPVGAAAVPAVAETAAHGTGSLPDFSAIVAAQGPAVVNISVAATMKATAMAMPDIDPDSPLAELFRRFGVPGPQGRQGHPGRIPRRGVGSGFIVSQDGIVLTNAHVVADADEVTVKLTDKREFRARVIGIDKQTDVAVLRIDARGLPTVRIGNPEQTRVGEWVVAIGAPFGFENSVTAGIVSAKSRSLPDEGYVPFMQTDVAVNPGNSGGPLINARGEVIGINSQIYSRSGGYQGLSFAIPIDVAMNVQQQLLSKGKVSRGRLGVSIQEVDQALADSFGLDRPRGALVSGVDAGSPAAKAGIETGDIILKFNGADVSRSSELPAMVAASAPGSDARLEIWRKGATKDLHMTVGEMGGTLAKADDKSGSAGGGKLGLAVRPLNAEERSEVEGGRGVRVEDVADGPAARAGIRPGDIIISVNGEPLASADQLRARVERGGSNVALLVQRGERRIFVPIRIG